MARGTQSSARPIGRGGAAGAPAPSLLTIRYIALLADPASHVDRIIDFFHLHVRYEQRQAAMALVKPQQEAF